MLHACCWLRACCAAALLLRCCSLPAPSPPSACSTVRSLPGTRGGRPSVRQLPPLLPRGRGGPGTPSSDPCTEPGSGTRLSARAPAPARVPATPGYLPPHRPVPAMRPGRHEEGGSPYSAILTPPYTYQEFPRLRTSRAGPWRFTTAPSIPHPIPGIASFINALPSTLAPGLSASFAAASPKPEPAPLQLSSLTLSLSLSPRTPSRAAVLAPKPSSPVRAVPAPGFAPLAAAPRSVARSGRPSSAAAVLKTVVRLDTSVVRLDTPVVRRMLPLLLPLLLPCSSTPAEPAPSVCRVDGLSPLALPRRP
ncbi:hypothetical protein CDD83_9702 [Cordyceps sp. RAO-2017]|nr:hypothetical protein CDD83_9702 [Cordyceps sp. RAO-2017]